MPPVPAVVKWFENRAPEELPLIPKEPAPAHNPYREKRGEKLPASRLKDWLTVWRNVSGKRTDSSGD